jgi:hypothetical protein
MICIRSRRACFHNNISQDDHMITVVTAWLVLESPIMALALDISPDNVSQSTWKLSQLQVLPAENCTHNDGRVRNCLLQSDATISHAISDLNRFEASWKRKHVTCMNIHPSTSCDEKRKTFHRSSYPKLIASSKLYQSQACLPWVYIILAISIDN